MTATRWASCGRNLIQDVWATNLEAEFENIRNTILICPYVAMDTEFPGIVGRPVGNFASAHEFYYQTLRCNVNLLRIIQLGLTLVDEKGDPPPTGPCTWQFNFLFCLNSDVYAQDSIDLLATSGINFERLEKEGVDVVRFAELLTTSGLVLIPEISWISFHSGYDFGYLIKILSGCELPEKEIDFLQILHLYFPCLYDIKYILKKNAQALYTKGLENVAEELNVRRIGPSHQAGSDSLLTALCFFALLQMRQEPISSLDSSGIVFGLGDDHLESVPIPSPQPNPATDSENTKNQPDKKPQKGEGECVRGPELDQVKKTPLVKNIESLTLNDPDP